MRTSQRRRLLKPGLIVFNGGRSTASCTLRNLSDGGALLKLESTVGVPAEFDLSFEGRILKCRSTRRTLKEVGVSFLDG